MAGPPRPRLPEGLARGGMVAEDDRTGGICRSGWDMGTGRRGWKAKGGGEKTYMRGREGEEWPDGQDDGGSTGESSKSARYGPARCYDQRSGLVLAPTMGPPHNNGLQHGG